MRIRGNTPAAALALAAALFLALAVIAALFVRQGYRDALERGEQTAANAAQTVAAHFQWIMETSRQALNHIEDTLRFRPELLTGANIETLGDAVAGLPADFDVRIYDANGSKIMSLTLLASEISVADRGYFQALRNGQATVISPLLVDRITGRQSFVIARRLELNGDFAGIAAIVIPSNLISGFWATLKLGPDSAASIVRDDGWVVTRYPPLDEAVNLREHVLFTHYLPAADSGWYGPMRSPADGIERIAGFYRVPGAPLVAVAAVSAESALAGYKIRMRRLALGAVPALLGLAGFSWWVFHLLSVDLRRRAELEEALHQNRLLFREIHHRVKNNMQTVASLIRLHPVNPETRRDLTERIAAMAAVHEQIYSSDRFHEVRLDRYLKNVVDGVRSSYGEAVAIEYDIEPADIDPDSAMTIGLIVTEVVTNSLKHGFPDGRSGTVRISLFREPENKLRLAIRDDGVGFDAGDEAKAGLGMRLIRGFSRQLGGEFELCGEQGTAFDLTFPDRSATDASG